MKCMFCGVQTGTIGNHASVDACADVLRVEVKRLIDRGGVWPFAEACPGEPRHISAAEFEELWFHARQVSLLSTLASAG
jgi:hypothetical protein